MTCQTCAIPHSGCIDIKCAECVARAVIGARPVKARQNMFIEVARRAPGGATEADIIAAIKKIEAEK